MVNQSRVFTLVVFLSVVLALMGVILVYNAKAPILEENMVFEGNRDNNSEFRSSYVSYIEINSDVEKKSTKNNIVNDDYVRGLDSDSNLVIKAEDGSIYSVKAGNLIVANRVVTIDETGKEVYDIEEPAKSISSN